MSTLRGGQSYTEALGLDAGGLAVIETDGSYEQVDSLKAAFDGAPDTGMNVFDHSLDVVAPASRHRGPPAGARRPVPDLPGMPGGHQLRRGSVYAPVPGGNGFANPSVYCADLLKLISHMAATCRSRHTGRGEGSRPRR